MNRTEDVPRRLANETLAITGRLAAMTRTAAVKAIAAAGGRFVAEPDETTTILVVGAGGAPLGVDGRWTRSLARARALQASGCALRILGEEQWLDLLELDQHRGELQRLYTTEQLARILSVPVGAVRSWLRHGLIRPARSVGRLAFFEFRQVSTARGLLELSRSGVPPARIRRSLEQLAGWFDGADRALAQLEALEAGGALLVRLDDGRLAEPSGQLCLDFEPRGEVDPEPPSAAVWPAAARTEAAPVLRALAPAPPPATWFERGLRAEEEGCFQEAVYAYERALALEGATAEIWFNLGNVHFVLDCKPAAAQAFAAALELEPDYVEAWNNLANVHSELGHHAEALKAYARALALAPDYADAHYNCAETLAAIGDKEGARRHWQAYLLQDPSSAWAREVRRKLEDLDERG